MRTPIALLRRFRIIARTMSELDKTCFAEQIMPVLEEAVGGWLDSESLALDLMQEVEAAIRNGDGRTAPDQYTIRLHPADLAAIGSSAFELQVILAERIEAALRTCGYGFSRRVHVSLTSDLRALQKRADVFAWHSRPPQAAQSAAAATPTAQGVPPEGAFLIVAGQRYFPLTQGVMNIGRLPDNHLVLPDPRVSRRHAQLRARRGKYALLDLGSTAGTLVNGVVIRDRTLRPGDLLRIAIVELVYAEDPTGPPRGMAEYSPGDLAWLPDITAGRTSALVDPAEGN